MTPHDPSDQGWLFNELGSMRQQMTDQHQRLRADMMAEFDKIRAMFAAHEREDRVTQQRVTVIEVEREMEAKQAAKVGTLAGVVGAAGLTAVVEAVKHWLGGAR